MLPCVIQAAIQLHHKFKIAVIVSDMKNKQTSIHLPPFPIYPWGGGGGGGGGRGGDTTTIIRPAAPHPPTSPLLPKQISIGNTALEYQDSEF